jgi:hypothetical protein
MSDVMDVKNRCPVEWGCNPKVRVSQIGKTASLARRSAVMDSDKRGMTAASNAVRVILRRRLTGMVPDA